MESLGQKSVIIATSAAVLFITTFGIVLCRRRSSKHHGKDDNDGTSKSNPTAGVNYKYKELKMPSDWKQIGRVCALRIHPMKSGRVVNLTKAEATEFGLQEIARKDTLALRDRVFVVYRVKDNKNLSAKLHPKLMKLTVNSLSSDSVEISLEKEKFIMKLPQQLEFNELNLSNETMSTIDCGDEVGAWVSKVLLDQAEGLRIGYWPGSKRNASEAFGEYVKVYKNFCDDYMGAYSDMGSYLIINKSSIDDLNAKIDSIKDRVTADNFRPNIVIEGAMPYSEDQWAWIKIGDDAIFRTFKPCTRCSITTINPETLERSKAHEPIKTLKSYRLLNEIEQRKLDRESPVMGMYAGLHSKGRLKIGDPIFIGSS